MLTWLTGKGYGDWDVVMRAEEEKGVPAADSYAAAALEKRPEGGRMWLAGIGFIGLVSAVGLGIRRRAQEAK
jgi:hypothetical protein